VLTLSIDACCFRLFWEYISAESETRRLQEYQQPATIYADPDFTDVLFSRCAFENLGDGAHRVFCRFHPFVWGFLLLVNIPFFILDLQLIVLHIYLRWQGYTTYEYVMIKSNIISRQDVKNNKKEANGCVDNVKTEQAEADVVTLKTGRKVRIRRGFRVLPQCFDWFLFKKKSRCPEKCPHKTEPRRCVAPADS